MNILRVKLDGCILGANTKVGTKAELSRVVTQAGYEVDAGGTYERRDGRGHLLTPHIAETYRNEKLELSDWAARNGSTDDDDEEESEDSEDS